MDDLVLKLIANCLDDRISQGLAPSAPTLGSVIENIKASISRLEDKRIIRTGQTINDIYIEILDNEIKTDN